MLWLLATAAVLAAVWSMPRKFKSEAILAVEPLRPPGRNAAASSDAELRAQLHLARLRVLQRDHLLGILRKSWPELVARWDARQAPREAERIRGRITITTLPESRGRFSALRISFETHDPARGAAVVNRVAADLAQEFERITQWAPARSSHEGRNAAWARLAECRQALNDFESEHGPDLEVREQTLLKVSASLQAELAANQRASEQAGAERRLLELALEQPAPPQPESAEPAGSPPMREPPGIRQLRERLALLRVRYTETHPDVRRAEQELEQALALELMQGNVGRESGAQAVARTSRNHNLERIRTNLDSAKRRIQQLEQERNRLETLLGEHQQQLAEVSRLLGSRDTLGRECAAAEEAYHAVSAKTQTEDPGPRFRLVLLEEALPEGQPARPDRRILALLGALFALLPCAAIAAGREIGARAVLAALGMAPPATDDFSVTVRESAGDRLNGRHAAHAG